MIIQSSFVRFFAAGAAAVAATLALDAGPAGAADAPKPGLWTMTVNGAGMPKAMTMKTCIGAPAPGAMPFVPPTRPGMSCSRKNITKTASGMAIDMQCTANGMTMTTSGTVTGDLTSSYTTTMKSHMSGPNLPPTMTAEHSSTMTAKYLGACPTGMAPGTSKPG